MVTDENPTLPIRTPRPRRDAEVIEMPVRPLEGDLERRASHLTRIVDLSAQQELRRPGCLLGDPGPDAA